MGRKVVRWLAMKEETAVLLPIERMLEVCDVQSAVVSFVWAHGEDIELCRKKSRKQWQDDKR